MLGLWGGLYAVFTGTFYPSYVGRTEGDNVRVGGVLLVFFCAVVLLSEWKKQKKQDSDS